MTKLQKLYRELRIGGLDRENARYAAVKLALLFWERG